MESKINILHLEDNLEDAELLQSILRKGNVNFEYFLVANKRDYIYALKNQKNDLILSDYQLPDYNGSEALVFAKDNYPHIPFVFVSGKMGEEIAIESLLNGATDYVLKNKMERLVTAVLRAFKEAQGQKARRKAEEDLHRSEENFRRSISESPFGIRIVSPKGITVYANCAFLNIYEFRNLEEFANTPAKDRYTSESYIQHQKRKEKRINGHEVLDYEISIVRKNGEIRHVKVSRKEVLWNESIHFQVINQDITAQKNAEDKLHKLSKAVEQSPESIIITDTKGIIEYVNSTTCRLTGYTSEELIGKNPRIFSAGEKSKEEYAPLWNTIIAGKEWQGEFLNKKRCGELYWEAATISPILNEHGVKTHYLAIKKDITESKKLMAELIAAKEHAEESDRLKSAFLANISHEIRTPMNGILGFAELLKEQDLTVEEQQEYFRNIEKGSARMLNIINDIVDISKIEAGQIIVCISELNINEQIVSICNLFRQDIELKGLQISFENTLPWKDVIIRTDKEKLIAILSNLIKNAIKFTRTGIIEVGFGSTSSPTGQPELQFYVKDTGIGIHLSQQEFIFKRFRQGNESLNRKYEGAGLGLSISKAFVEKLGGKIWVESEEGKGSTFYFTLPLLMETEEKQVVNKDIFIEDQEKSIKKLKILIAEDDEGCSKFLNLAVRRISKKTLIVQNGLEAIEACHNNPDIDLVLMDIQMPGMDGYKATRQIRQFNTKVIIIAQTAFALSGENEKAIEAGCNDYISKPIQKNQLISMVGKYYKEIRN